MATYHDSASSVEENKSSGWILILLGAVGLVFVVLALLGVIPIKIGNQYLFYGVIIAMAILFIVMGVVSFRNAKLFAVKATSDKQLRDRLIEWSKENLDAKKIDLLIKENLGYDDINTISEEEMYFKRTACIFYQINHQFVNLDQGFLENLVDNTIYDMIFSEEK